jgi:hypothetical protein
MIFIQRTADLRYTVVLLREPFASVAKWDVRELWALIQNFHLIWGHPNDLYSSVNQGR